MQFLRERGEDHQPRNYQTNISIIFINFDF